MPAGQACLLPVWVALTDGSFVLRHKRYLFPHCMFFTFSLQIHSHLVYLSRKPGALLLIDPLPRFHGSNMILPRTQVSCSYCDWIHEGRAEWSLFDQWSILWIVCIPREIVSLERGGIMSSVSFLYIFAKTSISRAFGLQ